MNYALQEYLEIKREHLGYNEYRVLEALLDGPLDRDCLCGQLEMNRTTCYDQLAKLMRKGIVKKWRKALPIKGRPREWWEVRDEFLEGLS